MMATADKSPTRAKKAGSGRSSMVSSDKAPLGNLHGPNNGSSNRCSSSSLVSAPLGGRLLPDPLITTSTEAPVAEDTDEVTEERDEDKKRRWMTKEQAKVRNDCGIVN